MNAREQQPAGLALLRQEFPPHQISKLPKPTISNEEWKKLPKAKCEECGGYHATSKTIHLDYVGHAALTDRLLDCDPNWTWEPLSLGPDGYPVIDKNGGMWIKLTVCGVTRLGYGDSQGKTGGNAIKECIGDALRNAAMRFGAALELWHKGSLHIDDDGVVSDSAIGEQKKTQPERVRLPKLSDDEAAHEYQKWVEIKSICTDEDGHPDNEKIANEWGKLPSNIRSAIKRYGDSLKKPTPQDFAEQA